MLIAGIHDQVETVFRVFSDQLVDGELVAILGSLTVAPVNNVGDRSFRLGHLLRQYLIVLVRR